MRKSIDLRSDTVTQPDAGMRRAMAEAAVGEELHHEDPTSNLLESRVADLLGKEAALFVPTGTMGNLVALKAHTQPGEEVMLEEQSHIYECEMAGLAAVCGLLARPVHGDDHGMLAWEEVRRRIRPRVHNRSQSRLICLENTHNFAGGTIPDQRQVVELCRRAQEFGLKVHLDGARLVNASVASGRSLADLAAPVDSVMIDFAKGLGAPAGAALAGPAAWIEQARRVRKLLGGAIHQAGILAAACLWGLDHNFALLARDHDNARRLAQALAALPAIVVDPRKVVTNIVIARLGSDLAPAAFCASLKEKGVLVSPLEDGRLRFVTHRDLSEGDIELAIEAITEVCAARV
ncbi:MAG: low specificity L-threonine aldolase [Acidobacteria bacterium]|nr:low specificity L-threonine aldolase [Acidobacteriota bacterium]